MKLSFQPCVFVLLAGTETPSSTGFSWLQRGATHSSRRSRIRANDWNPFLFERPPKDKKRRRGSVTVSLSNPFSNYWDPTNGANEDDYYDPGPPRFDDYYNDDPGHDEYPYEEEPRYDIFEGEIDPTLRFEERFVVKESPARPRHYDTSSYLDSMNSNSMGSQSQPVVGGQPLVPLTPEPQPKRETIPTTTTASQGLPDAYLQAMAAAAANRNAQPPPQNLYQQYNQAQDRPIDPMDPYELQYQKLKDQLQAKQKNPYETDFEDFQNQQQQPQDQYRAAQQQQQETNKWQQLQDPYSGIVDAEVLPENQEQYYPKVDVQFTVPRVEDPRRRVPDTSDIEQPLTNFKATDPVPIPRPQVARETGFRAQTNPVPLDQTEAKMTEKYRVRPTSDVEQPLTNFRATDPVPIQPPPPPPANNPLPRNPYARNQTPNPTTTNNAPKKKKWNVMWGDRSGAPKQESASDLTRAPPQPRNPIIPPESPPFSRREQLVQEFERWDPQQPESPEPQELNLQRPDLPKEFQPNRPVNPTLSDVINGKKREQRQKGPNPYEIPNPRYRRASPQDKEQLLYKKNQAEMFMREKQESKVEHKFVKWSDIRDQADSGSFFIGSLVGQKTPRKKTPAASWDDAPPYNRAGGPEAKTRPPPGPFEPLRETIPGTASAFSARFEVDGPLAEIPEQATFLGGENGVVFPMQGGADPAIPDVPSLGGAAAVFGMPQDAEVMPSEIAAAAFGMPQDAESMPSEAGFGQPMDVEAPPVVFGKPVDVIVPPEIFGRPEDFPWLAEQEEVDVSSSFPAGVAAQDLPFGGDKRVEYWEDPNKPLPARNPLVDSGWSDSDSLKPKKESQFVLWRDVKKNPDENSDLVGLAKGQTNTQSAFSGTQNEFPVGVEPAQPSPPEKVARKSSAAAPRSTPVEDLRRSPGFAGFSNADYLAESKRAEAQTSAFSKERKVWTAAEAAKAKAPRTPPKPKLVASVPIVAEPGEKPQPSPQPNPAPAPKPQLSRADMYKSPGFSGFSGMNFGGNPPPPPASADATPLPDTEAISNDILSAPPAETPNAEVEATSTDLPAAPPAPAPVVPISQTEAKEFPRKKSPRAATIPGFLSPPAEVAAITGETKKSEPESAPPEEDVEEPPEISSGSAPTRSPGPKGKSPRSPDIRGTKGSPTSPRGGYPGASPTTQLKMSRYSEAEETNGSADKESPLNQHSPAPQSTAGSFTLNGGTPLSSTPTPVEGNHEAASTPAPTIADAYSTATRTAKQNPTNSNKVSDVAQFYATAAAAMNSSPQDQGSAAGSAQTKPVPSAQGSQIAQFYATAAGASKAPAQVQGPGLPNSQKPGPSTPVTSATVIPYYVGSGSSTPAVRSAPPSSAPGPGFAGYYIKNPSTPKRTESSSIEVPGGSKVGSGTDEDLPTESGASSHTSSTSDASPINIVTPGNPGLASVPGVTGSQVAAAGTFKPGGSGFQSPSSSGLFAIPGPGVAGLRPKEASSSSDTGSSEEAAARSSGGSSNLGSGVPGTGLIGGTKPWETVASSGLPGATFPGAGMSKPPGSIFNPAKPAPISSVPPSETSGSAAPGIGLNGVAGQGSSSTAGGSGSSSISGTTFSGAGTFKPPQGGSGFRPPFATSTSGLSGSGVTGFGPNGAPSFGQAGSADEAAARSSGVSGASVAGPGTFTPPSGVGGFKPPPLAGGSSIPGTGVPVTGLNGGTKPWETAGSSGLPGATFPGTGMSKPPGSTFNPAKPASNVVVPPSGLSSSSANPPSNVTKSSTPGTGSEKKESSGALNEAAKDLPGASMAGNSIKPIVAFTGSEIGDPGVSEANGMTAQPTGATMPLVPASRSGPTDAIILGEGSVKPPGSAFKPAFPGAETTSNPFKSPPLKLPANGGQSWIPGAGKATLPSSASANNSGAAAVGSRLNGESSETKDDSQNPTAGEANLSPRLNMPGATGTKQDPSSRTSLGSFAVSSTPESGETPNQLSSEAEALTTSAGFDVTKSTLPGAGSFKPPGGGFKPASAAAVTAVGGFKSPPVAPGTANNPFKAPPLNLESNEGKASLGSNPFTSEELHQGETTADKPGVPRPMTTSPFAKAPLDGKTPNPFVDAAVSKLESHMANIPANTDNGKSTYPAAKATPPAAGTSTNTFPNPFTSKMENSVAKNTDVTGSQPFGAKQANPFESTSPFTSPFTSKQEGPLKERPERTNGTPVAGITTNPFLKSPPVANQIPNSFVQAAPPSAENTANPFVKLDSSLVSPPDAPPKFEEKSQGQMETVGKFLPTPPNGQPPFSSSDSDARSGFSSLNRNTKAPDSGPPSSFYKSDRILKSPEAKKFTNSMQKGRVYVEGGKPFINRERFFFSNQATMRALEEERRKAIEGGDFSSFFQKVSKIMGISSIALGAPLTIYLLCGLLVANDNSIEGEKSVTLPFAFVKPEALVKRTVSTFDSMMFPKIGGPEEVATTPHDAELSSIKVALSVAEVKEATSAPEIPNSIHPKDDSRDSLDASGTERAMFESDFDGSGMSVTAPSSDEKLGLAATGIPRDVVAQWYQQTKGSLIGKSETQVEQPSFQEQLDRVGKFVPAVKEKLGGSIKNSIKKVEDISADLQAEIPKIGVPDLQAVAPDTSTETENLDAPMGIPRNSLLEWMQKMDRPLTGPNALLSSPTASDVNVPDPSASSDSKVETVTKTLTGWIGEIARPWTTTFTRPGRSAIVESATSTDTADSNERKLQEQPETTQDKAQPTPSSLGIKETSLSIDFPSTVRESEAPANPSPESLGDQLKPELNSDFLNLEASSPQESHLDAEVSSKEEPNLPPIKNEVTLEATVIEESSKEPALQATVDGEMLGLDALATRETGIDGPNREGTPDMEEPITKEIVQDGPSLSTPYLDELSVEGMEKERPSPVLPTLGGEQPKESTQLDQKLTPEESEQQSEDGTPIPSLEEQSVEGLAIDGPSPVLPTLLGEQSKMTTQLDQKIIPDKSEQQSEDGTPSKLNQAFESNQDVPQSKGLETSKVIKQEPSLQEAKLDEATEVEPSLEASAITANTMEEPKAEAPILAEAAVQDALTEVKPLLEPSAITAITIEEPTPEAPILAETALQDAPQEASLASTTLDNTDELPTEAEEQSVGPLSKLKQAFQQFRDGPEPLDERQSDEPPISVLNTMSGEPAVASPFQKEIPAQVESIVEDPVVEDSGEPAVASPFQKEIPAQVESIVEDPVVEDSLLVKTQDATTGGFEMKSGSKPVLFEQAVGVEASIARPTAGGETTADLDLQAEEPKFEDGLKDKQVVVEAKVEESKLKDPPLAEASQESSLVEGETKEATVEETSNEEPMSVEATSLPSLDETTVEKSAAVKDASDLLTAQSAKQESQIASQGPVQSKEQPQASRGGEDPRMQELKALEARMQELIDQLKRLEGGTAEPATDAPVLAEASDAKVVAERQIEPGPAPITADFPVLLETKPEATASPQPEDSPSFLRLPKLAFMDSNTMGTKAAEQSKTEITASGGKVAQQAIVVPIAADSEQSDSGSKVAKAPPIASIKVATSAKEEVTSVLDEIIATKQSVSIPVEKDLKGSLDVGEQVMTIDRIQAALTSENEGSDPVKLARAANVGDAQAVAIEQTSSLDATVALSSPSAALFESISPSLTAFATDSPTVEGDGISTMEIKSSGGESLTPGEVALDTPVRWSFFGGFDQTGRNSHGRGDSMYSSTS